MTKQVTIVGALIVLATVSCSTGAGLHAIPPAASDRTQSAASAPESALRDASTRRPAKPVAIATGLVDPTALLFHGKDVLIGDVGTVDRVQRNGGRLQAVLTGTSIFDSGSSRGVDRMAVIGPTLFAGFGGYVEYHVVRAPIATGAQTLLASISGGDFIGVFGTDVYYSRGFCCIDRLPAVGGSAQTVLTGVWLRSLATDAASVYFVDYWTKSVYRFDVATSALAPLLTGNATEGKLIVDLTNVYFSEGTTVKRIPKAGGPAVTIYTGTAPRVLAVDDDDLFIAEGNQILAVPLAGGAARTLVTGVNVGTAIASKRRLFYIDSSQGVGAAVLYSIATGP